MASSSQTLQPLQEKSLKIARSYMDLSSAHKLEKVFALFSADATYKSESLRGFWSGLQDIQDMMRPFFEKFPDVKWEVKDMFITDQPHAGSDNSAAAADTSAAAAAAAAAAGTAGAGLEGSEDGCSTHAPETRAGLVHVEVRFVRHWTEPDGTKMESPGREWISVDPQQERIVHVHVAKLGSFWDFW